MHEHRYGTTLSAGSKLVKSASSKWRILVLSTVGMNNTVEVQVISEHREVLLSLLQRQGRTLTQEQLDAICQHFKAHDDAKSRQAPRKLKQGLLGTTFKDLTHLAQTVIDTVEDMSGISPPP